MFRLIFELFLIYMLYKLIVDFIIPVYRATRTMKDAVRKAQDQMKNQQYNQTTATTQKPEPQAKIDHDYIDYEDVR